MIPVVVAAGSNLGDRRAHLDRAIVRLRALLEVEAISSTLETPPEDGSSQPHYLNLVVTGQTELSPPDLLRELLRIEDEEGRTRSSPGAARTLDLDLIFHGDTVRRSPDPILPHPRWHRRPFVVAPLLEVAPDRIDPATGQSVTEVAAGLGLLGPGPGPRSGPGPRPGPGRRAMASRRPSVAGIPRTPEAP